MEKMSLTEEEKTEFKAVNKNNESVKTNFRNSEIIDGEYKVINDENEKK